MCITQLLTSLFDICLGLSNNLIFWAIFGPEILKPFYDIQTGLSAASLCQNRASSEIWNFMGNLHELQFLIAGKYWHRIPGCKSLQGAENLQSPCRRNDTHSSAKLLFILQSMQLFCKLMDIFCIQDLKFRS